MSESRLCVFNDGHLVNLVNQVLLAFGELEHFPSAEKCTRGALVAPSKFPTWLDVHLLVFGHIQEVYPVCQHRASMNVSPFSMESDQEFQCTICSGSWHAKVASIASCSPWDTPLWMDHSWYTIISTQCKLVRAKRKSNRLLEQEWLSNPMAICQAEPMTRRNIFGDVYLVHEQSHPSR